MYIASGTLLVCHFEVPEKKNFNFNLKSAHSVSQPHFKMLLGSVFLILFIGSLAKAENATTTESSSSTSSAPVQNKDGFSSCENPNQCNLSEGFICKDGFCKCAYDALKFDPVTKKCMASIGKQCGFFIGSPNSTMAPCPENSMCVWDNDAFKASYQYVEKYCVCMDSYYRDDSGNCVPYAKFSEECNEKRKCDAESDLVCSSSTSTCQCPFGTDQYYDGDLRKCISFVGGNCSMYCVEDAFCENFSPEISTSPKRWSNSDNINSMEYTRDTLSICQCRPGYEPTPDRRCRLIPPGYNSPCYGESEQCDSKRNLRCIDKICSCQNPLHQTYSFELGRCVGSVGDICDASVENSCVPNAECVKDESSSSSSEAITVCQCNKGFSATPSRKCMKSFGQQCQNEFCNVFAGLACINKTCQCYDSFLKYDESLKACVSSVGAPCGKVYMPMELEDFSMNGNPNSLRHHPFMTNAVRNQYMSMKSMCMECDSYQIGCPKGSVCASETDVLVVVRGKEKKKCRVPPT